MWEKILQRLREMGNNPNKRPLKETMLIIFLSGILIFVILLPTDKNSKKQISKDNTNENQQTSGGTETTEKGIQKTATEEYKKELEKELEDFLASVEGVGEVKVLIYVKESQRYIVEKDIPTSNRKSGEESQESKEEATVYTKNANGYDVPFITQTQSPSIDGVIIAAEGASNEIVRLKIVKLVMALYGIEANKVEVSELMIKK